MKVGKERFEDHCWKDVVPAEDLKLYETYVRDTYIGPNAAVLAIDLYNIVYRGGPHSPYELDATFPNSCGIYAHQAIAPTQAVLAAARAAGMRVAIAGRIAMEQIPVAWSLGPDVVAVRSAVCFNGREGTVRADLVRRAVGIGPAAPMAAAGQVPSSGVRT